MAAKILPWLITSVLSPVLQQMEPFFRSLLQNLAQSLVTQIVADLKDGKGIDLPDELKWVGPALSAAAQSHDEASPSA